jgi:hypothetical protein
VEMDPRSTERHPNWKIKLTVEGWD